MRKSVKSAIIFAACAVSFNAFAQSHIDEVWMCELRDGKTIEDVHAANAEWVKHMNSAVDVGDIKSGTVTPIVGEQGQFLFVDSYPTLEAWTAAEAYQATEEGKAAMKSIEDALQAASDCTSNRLYKFTPN